jgi:hypothetical protein
VALFRRSGAVRIPLLLATADACLAQRPLPPAPVAIAVFVESDPGVPLTNAEVFFGASKVGTTGDDGLARLKLAGDEGQSFDLFVRCPEGYKSPLSPVTATVRRLAEPRKIVRYETSCPPTTREVIVAVMADKGPNLPVANLPVMYLGNKVALTDAWGAAHVLLRIAPGEQFSLVLDTSGKGAASLKPSNPVGTFTIKDKDEVFVFAPHFMLERAARPPQPSRPIEVRSQQSAAF